MTTACCLSSARRPSNPRVTNRIPNPQTSVRLCSVNIGMRTPAVLRLRGSSQARSDRLLIIVGSALESGALLTFQDPDIAGDLPA